MKEYKNILVNALVNLGDVVLTTSAVALLKRAYPAAKITMLVKPAASEAVIDNPVIDDVIVFAYKTKENSFGATLRMVREIRRRRFDLSISLDQKLRPALLAFLARIPERIGPSKVFDDKKSRVNKLYTKTVEINYDLDNTLQRETYQAIVRGVTGQSANETALPVFPTPKAENRAKAEKMLAALPKSKRKIALCVKGTFPLKTWPKEYFAAVASPLARKYDAALFIVGGPSDREYADEVRAGLSVPAANFCGETSLMDLAALYEKTDLLITVDTGGAHVAAAIGTKMVVVYGCTSPARWHVASENAIVLTANEACCPCSYRPDECPSAPKPNCLWHLWPQKVTLAAEKLLESD